MSLKQGYTNIYLLKYIIDDAIKNDDKLILHLNRKGGKRWQNNHELLIRNYELMKESRKRIIKQRDKLQKELIHYKQIEAELEFKKVHKYEAEITSLLQSLTNANGDISKLKIQNEKLRRTMNYQIGTIKNLEHIINQKEG